MLNRCCISLNNYCNINCKYCYFYNREDIDMKKVKSIDLIQLKSIIDKIYNYTEENDSSFKIGLVGSGEPLLDFNKIKNLIEWVKETKKDKRLSFYTISNGYSVSDNIIEFFKANKHIIALSFSLDGYKDTHNFCRVKKTDIGYIGTFDRVMNSVFKYEKAFGCKPDINVTVHRLIYNNVDEVYKYLVDNSFKKVTFSRLIDCIDSNISISCDEFDDFIRRIEQLNEEKQLEIRNIEVRDKKVDCTMYGAACGAGTKAIFFSGNMVYPCGRFIGDTRYEISLVNRSLFDVEKIYSEKMTNPDKICFYDNYVLKERNKL